MSLALAHTFHTLPQSERTQLKATEQRLTDIYEAARLGLKGESLALAAGLLPIEFNRLKQVDPLVEMAILKGKADSEAEMSQVMVKAAREGDAAAALNILKHQHGWQAAQQVNVSVQGQISITEALHQAEKRVIAGVYTEVTEVSDLPTTPAPTKLPALSSSLQRTTEVELEP